MLISTKCEFCHYFGDHLKTNILILTYHVYHGTHTQAGNSRVVQSSLCFALVFLGNRESEREKHLHFIDTSGNNAFFLCWAIKGIMGKSGRRGFPLAAHVHTSGFPIKRVFSFPRRGPLV